MLIGRHDFEKAMRLDPSSACLPRSKKEIRENNTSDEEILESVQEMSNILLSLRPIKQVWSLKSPKEYYVVFF